MDESKLPPGPSDNLATPDNKPQSRDSVDDHRLARICEHRSESQTDPSALTGLCSRYLLGCIAQ